MKATIARVLSSKPMVSAFSRVLLRNQATILTLHRFTHDEGVDSGVDADALDDALHRFRSCGFRFISLLDLVAGIRSGRQLPSRSIAITVDDGYFDFAEVAAPIFERHRCPVTVFLISGFLDGAWTWWDRADAAGLDGVALKTLPTEGRVSRIMEASAHLPPTPPRRYSPMSWEDVRFLESEHIAFAPHTVTHPILARSSDPHSWAEISGSWQRVKAECRRAVPLFAYPNGQAGDFGEREIMMLKEIGIAGAVTTQAGHVSSASLPYRLPRWDLTACPMHMGQVISGVEALKGRVRRSGSRR